MISFRKSLLLLIFLALHLHLVAENGYRLWLRYDKISNSQLLREYRKAIDGYRFSGESATLSVAAEELRLGLSGLLGKQDFKQNGRMLFAGKVGDLPAFNNISPKTRLSNKSEEAYLIHSTGKQIIIAANGDIGVLYGVFHFLRLLQTQQSLAGLDILEEPKLKIRILNHWDNLDRTVERGYAGFSIWDWHRLPEYLDTRYLDYARANASIGINGTVLTNVNANAMVLRPDYLEKVKALADLFRPYGIKVYLTARFSAPTELGKLANSDPLNPAVRAWWKSKIAEIYRLIPDFGGFVVKANSEGQPGPQNYGRTHADGANMLAEALEPWGGIVMWRAFVYSAEDATDRAKQAYSEFVPDDGKFRSNVMIQVKNGPIDFQPREPFHPMFGAMPKTPLMMEFQITQEYLGQGTHLVYLAPMWKEVLDADTHAKGSGSIVARVIDGSLDGQRLTGMAGVANIGNDFNWTGHQFGQANWYAFGRLTWNHSLSSEDIADEWLKMTFSNEPDFVGRAKGFMLSSHETCVNYMTPLGLHHIMATGHHYGPGPWVDNLSRPEWNPVYYHRADEMGVGFDRTQTGSDATAQYADAVAKTWADRRACPEKYLLWFHRVRWEERLSSGKTLWEELCRHYYKGADDAAAMRKTWQSLSKYVDKERFRSVDMLLDIQAKEAKWWRNACLLYFQKFSKMDIPADLERPDKNLEYYMKLDYPYSPGIKPQW